MASDYGGMQGSQPWHGAQPPSPHGQPSYGQPPYGQPPYGQPPYGQPPQVRRPPYDGPPYGQPSPGGPIFPEPPRREPSQELGAHARRRRTRSIAWALLVVGAIGVASCLIGVASQEMPRKFTASQQKLITNWEYGERWRDLSAGAIFPASVSYAPPASLDDDPSLTLAVHRVGIAKQASCASAADPTAAAVLDRNGCSAMLRATYVDETDSFVVTVGAAVLPAAAKASAAAQAIARARGAAGLGTTVRAVPFAGTPAGEFTDKQRQLSGVVSRGMYVILYTVGYTDSRGRQQVSRNSYTDSEMTGAGTGVADDVLSVLAAPVPAPRCPGTPGC